MNKKDATNQAIRILNNLNDKMILEEINISKFSEVREIVKALKEPITLADFLGWEEGVEYDFGGDIMKITDDGLELYDNVEEWFDLCDYYWTDDIIKELRQAKKVEPKLKAYHVKDEYSYKCLMRELEEQGYVWRHGGKPTKSWIWENAKYRDVIYCKENKTITYSNLPHYEQYEKENYDLIEYHKEEPRYYARYKGSINLYQDYNYYNYLAWKGVCVISDKGEVFDSIIQMTKTEWNKLGINDTNADFEKVEE